MKKDNSQKRRELLNLAGEFRVASELMRRGLYCSVTYGNSKGADLIVFNSGTKRALIVEVKSTVRKNFVTGFYQKYKSEELICPDFWVLYHQDEKDIKKDRFFIFTHNEIAAVQAIRNKSSEKTWGERADLHAKGVDNILMNDIADFEDQWKKIEFPKLR